MIKRPPHREKKLQAALRQNLLKRKVQARAWTAADGEEATFWSIADTGVKLYVRLSPASDRAAIGGVYHGEHGRIWVKASVTQPPEDGKANDGLIALIGDSLSIAKSRITIESGATHRLKTVLLPPLSQDQMAIMGAWAMADNEKA